jgi:hypothetical protein
VSKLQEEVARLRVDKLELLRQILSLQDRESQLQSDLCVAGKEIRRLKFGIQVEDKRISEL